MTLLVYNKMVDVDFGCNRWHVGWGKGSIFSLFDKDEWWRYRGLKHTFMRGEDNRIIFFSSLWVLMWSWKHILWCTQQHNGIHCSTPAVGRQWQSFHHIQGFLKLVDFVGMVVWRVEACFWEVGYFVGLCFLEVDLFIVFIWRRIWLHCIFFVSKDRASGHCNSNTNGWYIFKKKKCHNNRQLLDGTPPS